MARFIHHLKLKAASSVPLRTHTVTRTQQTKKYHPGNTVTIIVRSELTRFQLPPAQTAALVFSFGRGVSRRYGFTALKLGNSILACSSLTDGAIITSSPGSQLIGVVTLCMSPVCSESTIRSTSAVLRPVEAGYERIVRILFAGSMMNTERIVKAMPLLSTFVTS